MDWRLLIQGFKDGWQYERAQAQARAVLQDAEARMDAVADEQSPVYRPDLGNVEDWLWE